MKSTLQELLKSLPEPVLQHIQHLERMRQDFVGNVSHELRTPLTVIHGYLEVLLDQDLDETKPCRKIFSQMHQQTMRMENLVENLLLLAQLEDHDNIQKEEHIVNVSELLSGICTEATELSNGQNHKITLQTDKSLLLCGWEEELYSLFSNIIFNAVKYTPAKGRIDIEWRLLDSEAHFVVKDTGIGIASEHLPRVTERFYRVDPARSRASGGTGLGLALVKHILLRHQARLDVHSELGKGSIFTCIFPMERVVQLE